MHITDDGTLNITVKRPDGSEVSGAVPVYEGVNHYAAVARDVPDLEFWPAWNKYLEQFGLTGISYRAGQRVYLALVAAMEDFRKKDSGSPSAS